MLSTKLFLLLSCLVSVALTQPKKGCGVSNSDLTKATNILNGALCKHAKDNEGQSYEIKTVHKVTKPMRPGLLFKMNVDLSDKTNSQVVNNCNVEIKSNSRTGKSFKITLQCAINSEMIIIFYNP
ncbi:uncharacterized protein [Eurosta solidaginis]|uniref:uncharacterized protein n=1 Tax=Eurosta solidaginis TaxID=178769 RepID=UPI00353061C2